MKKNTVALAVGAVALVGAGFGGGYTYAKSQAPSGARFMMATNGMGNVQFTRGTGMGGNRMMGNFTSGEILSKDANSITVKMPDGSTKIVLVGGTAQILTSATTTSDALVVGKNVTVTGTTNSDGSITAQSIQLRPAGMNFERATTTRQQ